MVYKGTADIMTVRELIEKLESYDFLVDEDYDNIPVRTFDLDRYLCDVSEVEFCKNYDGKCYIYIGA